jgi:hypothetical protein
LARSLIGSSRSIASALVMPRYASRRSTTRHPRPVVVTDTSSLDRSRSTRSRPGRQTCHDQGGRHCRHPQGAAAPSDGDAPSLRLQPPEPARHFTAMACSIPSWSPTTSVPPTTTGGL